MGLYHCIWHGASENVLATFTKQYSCEDVMISTKFTPQIENLTDIMGEIGAKHHFPWHK